MSNNLKKTLDDIENMIPYSETELITLRLNYIKHIKDSKFILGWNEPSFVLDTEDLKINIPNIPHTYGRYTFPTSLSTGHNIEGKGYYLKEYVFGIPYNEVDLDERDMLLLKIQVLLSSQVIFEKTSKIPELETAIIKDIDPRYITYIAWGNEYRIYAKRIVVYSNLIDEGHQGKENLDYLISLLK